jgi:hypothetical protein
MVQDRPAVDHWEFPRETVDLIPLIVETYSASTAAWTPTTSYTVTCVPVGVRPATFATPTAAGSDLGYLVNGPTLGKGTFDGFIKLSANPETPVLPAFTLELT